MYLLAGLQPEPLGPGSKEKKSALVALGSALGLELSDVPGKAQCGRMIAARLGTVWDHDCYSNGDTITLVGLSRILDEAVTYLVRQPGRLPPDVLSGLLDRARTIAKHPLKEARPMPLALSEIEQNIAERLELLSTAGPAPDGVSSLPARVDFSRLRFDDGSWRAYVEQAQGWMHLPVEVAGNTPEEFEQALGLALTGDETPLDRHSLLDRLAERLDRAVELRNRFIENIEGAVEGRATLETATQEWIDAWEEVDDEEEAEVGGSIKASADVWSIMDFVQRAIDDELNLSPSYQRADVWATSDAQLLIESVLRGIPLPSIILLQDPQLGSSFEVVDGKQRLTSILRFMGHHPRALEIVRQKSYEWGHTDLIETFQGNYPGFRKLWKEHEQVRLTAQVERENYFPFPLRSGDVKTLMGRLAELRGKYYSEIRDFHVDVVGKQQRVRSIFEQTSSYKVPVILYEEVSSDQVHEVFSLYNKQGKHLNAEEIRNALFHRVKLMRALLATAGDAEEIDTVAPFLRPAWEDLSSTRQTLDRYGFGRAGYKRTKLLSWVAAVLFAEEGTVGTKSTAATVNALLKRVGETKSDPLRDEDLVREAMVLLDHGLDAHAAISDETWSPRFKNSQAKSGWQELQLVATLIALSAAETVLGESLLDRLEEVAPEIQTASESTLWRRPSKTQTATQWCYTANVVGDFLRILGVDAAEVENRIASRFGHSGLRSLLDRRRESC